VQGAKCIPIAIGIALCTLRFRHSALHPSNHYSLFPVHYSISIIIYKFVTSPVQPVN